jgi:hypothetical protein
MEVTPVDRTNEYDYPCMVRIRYHDTVTAKGASSPKPVIVSRLWSYQKGEPILPNQFPQVETIHGLVSLNDFIQPPPAELKAASELLNRQPVNPSSQNNGGCWSQEEIRSYETQKVEVLFFSAQKLSGDCRFSVNYTVLLPPDFTHKQSDLFIAIYRKGQSRQYEDQMGH